MNAVEGFFSSIWDFLTHPLRNDYPVWQLMLVATLFLIVAYAIIDNLFIIKDIASSAVEAVGEAV